MNYLLRTFLLKQKTLLKIPKFEYVSNTKPSLFAYPSLTKPPKKEAVIRVATAVLSTTAKVKAREKKKNAGDDMDLVRGILI